MARNAACAVEDRMELRVGLNLGDVIVEGDNLYGDGVNVAARIEASAEAGGIHMSAKFYEEVRRKLDMSFESLGDQHMKNIADPVATFRVNLKLEGTKVGNPHTPQGRRLLHPQDLALGGHFKPRHDVEQGGFAASGHALDGHMLAALKFKFEAFEQPRPWGIRMTHRGQTQNGHRSKGR